MALLLKEYSHGPLLPARCCFYGLSSHWIRLLHEERKAAAVQKEIIFPEPELYLLQLNFLYRIAVYLFDLFLLSGTFELWLLRNIRGYL